MLRSQKGQRIVAALPADRVVTETDGPYVKLGGRQTQPRDIPGVITGLARVWKQDHEAARDRVFQTMTAIAETARAARP
jgi:TatD DNase family protein